ncbi:MAG: YcxB family protein [Cytophagales bacterium]|nr:YcxB family protein [Cytophaga sp.]
MIVKTKRYQLAPKDFIKAGLWSIAMEQWWYIVFPVLLACVAFIMPDEKWWFIVPAIVAVALYVLFWYIQFYGASQMEQSKMMFEKMSYEIDSRQLLIKLNEKQGSPVKWETFKQVYKRKDDYLFMMGRGQFLLLPYKIFNSDNDLRFVDSILNRKELIKKEVPKKVVA